jgi:hypothetical protein
MLSKKTKLASAVGLAVVASGAMATPTFDWTHADGAFSAEGSASATSFNAPTITATMGAEYAKDDLITLAFSSNFLSTFTPGSSITAYKACSNEANTPATIAGTATENGGVVTLGLISNTANSATYRVANSTDAVTSANNSGTNATECANTRATLNTTIGVPFSLGTLTFDGPTVAAAGTLTGTYSATLSNGVTALDGGETAIADLAGTAATTDDANAILYFGDQYSIDASASSQTALLNGEIDVTASPTRSLFNSTQGTIRDQDILTIDLDEATTVAIAGATPAMTAAAQATDEVVTVVVSGDFSYLVDSDTSTAGLQNTAAVATCATNAATETFAADGSSITITCASGDFGNVVLTIDATANAALTTTAPALTPGAYTMAASMTYIDSGTDLNNAIDANDVAGSETLAAAGTSAGAWTLNGSTSTIQAYPVGSNIEQFVWVTNSGTTAGDITMTATQGGTTSAECALGSAGAKTLTSVSSAVNTCLTAAGVTSGRAQVALTVNAAAASVNVYAAYKVTSADDRLALTVTDGITD